MSGGGWAKGHYKPSLGDRSQTWQTINWIKIGVYAKMRTSITVLRVLSSVKFNSQNIFNHPHIIGGETQTSPVTLQSHRPANKWWIWDLNAF